MQAADRRSERRVPIWTRSVAAIAACLAAYGITASAGASANDAEVGRFPQPHISKEQWRQFLDETKGRPGAVVMKRADLTRIIVPEESAVYFFTKPRHPAHPAAVRRSIVAYDNKSYIHTSGYYAGDRV